MINKLKNILVRSIGVIMFAFIPGMAVGGPTVGWFMGGVIGVATVFSSIIIFFGVQLAWDAMISDEDISKGFRAAVAKQAQENAFRMSQDREGKGIPAQQLEEQKKQNEG
jgi:hypothetical protein